MHRVSNLIDRHLLLHRQSAVCAQRFFLKETAHAVAARQKIFIRRPRLIRRAEHARVRRGIEISDDRTRSIPHRRAFVVGAPSSEGQEAEPLKLSDVALGQRAARRGRGPTLEVPRSISFDRHRSGVA